MRGAAVERFKNYAQRIDREFADIGKIHPLEYAQDQLSHMYHYRTTKASTDKVEMYKAQLFTVYQSILQKELNLNQAEDAASSWAQLHDEVAQLKESVSQLMLCRSEDQDFFTRLNAELSLSERQVCYLSTQIEGLEQETQHLLKCVRSCALVRQDLSIGLITRGTSWRRRMQAL